MVAELLGLLSRCENEHDAPIDSLTRFKLGKWGSRNLRAEHSPFVQVCSVNSTRVQQGVFLVLDGNLRAVISLCSSVLQVAGHFQSSHTSRVRAKLVRVVRD